jgi:biopolymer transport protein ExbD
MAFSQGALDSDDEPVAEMNMVPMIDIALTLLVIMMLTSAFIHKPGISIRLPVSATREGAPEANRDMVVLVGRDGRLDVDGAPQSDRDLRTRLVRLGKASPEARVLIKGDRDVSYGRVMRVLDLVRQAGVSRVVLPTDPTAGSDGGPS